MGKTKESFKTNRFWNVRPSYTCILLTLSPIFLYKHNLTHSYKKNSKLGNFKSYFNPKTALHPLDHIYYRTVMISRFYEIVNFLVVDSNGNLLYNTTVYVQEQTISQLLATTRAALYT